MFSSEPRPDLGESAALQWTRTRLCRLLRDYFAATREPGAPPVRVGTDVPFYYEQGDRLARVTPDIYVIEGLGYEEQLRRYRVWERGGRVPELAIHLVDTAVSPEDGLMMHFFRLGLLDVVLYDPLWYLQPPATPSGRRLLSHYRRGAHKLVPQPQEHPARVYLPRQRIWLGHRGGADLRLYVEERSIDTGDAGDAPEAGRAGASFPPESACWPTAEERRQGT